MANISIQIKGVNKASAFINSKGKDAMLLTGSAINQATVFLQGEIKESIQGKRAETRSVDTSQFLQSISSEVNEKDLTGTISSDVDHAIYMEYGTSKINERRHFRNSASRNSEKITNFIKDKFKQL